MRSMFWPSGLMGYNSHMRFSEIEINHLLKAWLAIGFAFAIVLGGGFTSDFVIVFIISLLTVGIAFLLHEMAHKYVAQMYGCWAEFRSYDMGLALAIFMAILVHAVFAAPGAVMVLGMVTLEENGKIAAAGQIVNMVLAVMFWGLGLSFSSVGGWFPVFISYGYMVNSWLAFFNLIPFGPLDGNKVLAWSRPVWFVMIALAGYLTFVGL